MEESIFGFIAKENFLDALALSPLLDSRLLRTLSHEYTGPANSITLFSKKSVRERLALQLIVLRGKYKDHVRPGLPFEINRKRDDLGSLVGTAPENMVRIPTEFKEDGILETKGRKIIIHPVN